MNALTQLASDDAVAYDKQIDELATKVQSAGKFQDAPVNAVKGLAKFLFDAAASGYQRKKLGSAIKAADADVSTITDAVGTIIGTDYDLVLQNEELSVQTRYRDALQGDKNTGIQLILQQHWQDDLATVQAKRQAAKDYRDILVKIRAAHQALALSAAEHQLRGNKNYSLPISSI